MTLICAAGAHCRCGYVCKVTEKHYFCTLYAPSKLWVLGSNPNGITSGAALCCTSQQGGASVFFVPPRFYPAVPLPWPLRHLPTEACPPSPAPDTYTIICSPAAHPAPPFPCRSVSCAAPSSVFCLCRIFVSGGVRSYNILYK